MDTFPELTTQKSKLNSNGNRSVKNKTSLSSFGFEPASLSLINNLESKPN